MRFCRPSALTLLLIIVSYNAFFIAYSLQKHAAFQSAGFDLGIWEQMMWNTLHGRPFWFTQHGNITNGLGNHIELILLLFVPLLGIYNGPKMILVVQSVLVSWGAFPVYWFAKERLGSSVAGLVYVTVYLLYPALGAALSFDVHSLTLAVPFLTWALWAMFTERYRLFGVMAILALSAKEDMSLLIFMMGLYILLLQHQRKIGLITIVGSLIWFASVIYFIVPAFKSGDNEYIYRYQAWGNSSSEIVVNIITHPWRVIQTITAGDKLFYWIRLTMPVFFIALLDPLALLLAAPTLLINTLGNFPSAYQLDLFHSSAPLAAYVTFASINGMARLTRFAEPKLPWVRAGFVRNLLLMMMLAATLAYQVQFGHTPIGRFFNWPNVTERHQRIEKLLSQIPAQAAVAAENNLAPRLSHRQWLFVLPNLAYQNVQAEYIIMDMHGNLDRHRTLAAYCDQLNELLAGSDYGLIVADDGLLLFKAGAPDAVTFEPMPPCL